jgi:hypothetical protein
MSPGKVLKPYTPACLPYLCITLTFIYIELKKQKLHKLQYCIMWSTVTGSVLCNINASMAQCLTGDVHRYSGRSDISCFCRAHQQKPITGCLTSATSQVLPFYRIQVIQFFC